MNECKQLKKFLSRTCNLRRARVRSPVMVRAAVGAGKEVCISPFFSPPRWCQTWPRPRTHQEGAGTGRSNIKVNRVNE